MDEIKKEDIEKVIQDRFDSDNHTDPWWLVLMLLFMFNSKNDSITKDDHIKMKEDIAELKGKMSILEKMM